MAEQGRGKRMEPDPSVEQAAFYQLFRRDIAACKAGATALLTMVHNYRDPRDWARRIHEIENDGDNITEEIFALLIRSTATPFEREDIIALGSIIDDVLDAVDEVATMLSLYGIKAPSVYLLEASTLLVQAVENLAIAIDRLETGEDLEPQVQEVHRLETDCDGLYHNAIAELFLPGTYSAIDVIKWNRLYDLMENAVDKCEDVGNVLHNIVLKKV
jgi:predicted phosphate transport protein (TIGR00153 family)